MTARLFVYVDDFLLICKSTEVINKIKKELKTVFDITDLGDVSYFGAVSTRLVTKMVFVFQECYISSDTSEIFWRSMK